MLEHAAHVYLFGGLRLVFPRLTLAEGSIATRAAAVIKLLAIRPGHTAHRDEIAGTLWTDADQQRAANNFYKTLHQLREQLPAGDAKDLVRIQRKVVTLAPWAIVDLDDYLTDCENARETKSREAYDRALTHSRAPILPCDVYEDWTSEIRTFISHNDQQMRFEAAEVCVLNDDAPAAAAHLHAVLAVEPTNERAHRMLIESYAANGEPAKAARQYAACAAALASELALKPSAETTNLFRRVTTCH